MAKRALILDFNRTIYDPERDQLYPGVKEMLEEFRAERRMFLLSKREGGREVLLGKLGIAPHFEAMYFVPEKTAEHVRNILLERDLAPGDAIVVGDLITSELRAGREAGLETIWVRQGKFSELFALPHFDPTYEVRSISELHQLLRDLP